MDNNTGWTFKADPYIPNRYIISANGNWLMAIMHNGEQLVERQMENLQKAVAAPELLEALKLADAALIGARMNMKVVQRAVQTAIAKAEGR